MKERARELQRGGVSWWIAPGARPDELGPLLDAAARIPRGSPGNLKAGRRKELYRLTANGRRFLVKINRYDRSVSRLRRLRAGKAWRELRVALALDESGIETPVPVAAGERRRGGSLAACYLVIPLVEGARDLAALWRDGSPPAARRVWARELGRLARRVHDVGLDQDDFAPNNFLVPKELEAPILPIDFERARIRRAPLPDRARVRMLAALERHIGDASASARLRVLSGYFAGDRSQMRACWRAVGAAAPGVARRDLAHVRRTCAKPGRRYKRLAAGKEGAWQGWARRDARSLTNALRDLADAARHPGLAVGNRIDDRGPVWRIDAGAQSRRTALRAWATAQLLWMRGELAPQPVAMLRRDRRTLLWLERGARCQSCDALSDPAHRASVLRARRTLLRRLSHFGRFERDIQPHGISLEMSDGRWRAQLLDVFAFWPGRTP